MLLARVLVLFLVPAGCSSMQVTPPAGSAGDPFGLPRPTGALEFPQDVEEDVRLLWLVQQLARLTGQELVMDVPTLQIIQQVKEPLEIRTPVPADEVYEFVEAMLVSNDFYLAPLKGGTRPMLGVYAIAPGRASAGTPRTVAVEPAQLAELERHPALYCQILVTFENVDTRQLQTQLRQIMVDQSGITQCVPCGDRTLLLQGVSWKLTGLARVLADVDRASAPRPGQTPAQPAEAPASPDETPKVPGPSGPPR